MRTNDECKSCNKIYPYQRRDEAHDVTHCVYDAHHRAGEIGRDVQHGRLLPATNTIMYVTYVTGFVSVGCQTNENTALAAELQPLIISQPSDKYTVAIPVDGSIRADGETEQSYYEGHAAVGEGDADQENGCGGCSLSLVEL